MAKEEQAKVKMTVIHFETESENSTLQENIRAIAHTLTRALTPPQRVVSTPAQLSATNEETLLQTQAVEDQNGIDDGDLLSLSTSSKKKIAARQYRTPQPLEIDLISGDPRLKNFLDQKKPDGDVKRYLAIAYWLKHHRNIQEVTMDHIYTCYRHMGAGRQVPADAAAPLRAMKAKQYGWMKTGSAKGTYVINHLGENEVLNMGN
jgi:hypothetical protein